MLSAPADSMIMQPGTLQLTDCLNLCRQNGSCLAINFETGLCVLLQESADKNPQALQKSQFPVFTIYAHKICLQGKWLEEGLRALIGPEKKKEKKYNDMPRKWPLSSQGARNDSSSGQRSRSFRAP